MLLKEIIVVNKVTLQNKCACGAVINIKSLILKMGGLLCPHCNVIVYAPYVDSEYFKELERRKYLLKGDGNVNIK